MPKIHAILVIMQVLKRKRREGTGMFPVDAPVHDATVKIQYTLHTPSASKQAGSCIFTETPSSNVDDAKHLEATFATGEGCMAPAIEMAVKLMLPGEQSEVYFDSQYGFKDASEAPEGVPMDQPIVALLTLVGFEKEGHPQAMDAAEVRPLIRVAAILLSCVAMDVDWFFMLEVATCFQGTATDGRQLFMHVGYGPELNIRQFVCS